MEIRLTGFAALALTILLGLAGSEAIAQEGSKVVVLDFEDEGAGLTEEQSAKMADRLSGVFEKSGKYDVVPRDKFKAAVKAREKATGKPCDTRDCMRSVAHSLGANAVEPKVKKEGGGCSVSVGVAGEGGGAVAGGSVKRGCGASGLKVGMDGAMLLMTQKVIKDQPLPEIKAIQENAQAAAGKQKEVIVTTDAEEDEAELEAAGVEEQVDEEAEARAVKNEEEAARELGW